MVGRYCGVISPLSPQWGLFWCFMCIWVLVWHGEHGFYTKRNTTRIECVTSLCRWDFLLLVKGVRILIHRNDIARHICCKFIVTKLMTHKSLQWRHNDYNSVWNHQRLDCLLRRRPKKTSKLLVTGFCERNSPVTDDIPHNGSVTRKMFPCDDVIMIVIISCVLCQRREHHPRCHNWMIFHDHNKWMIWKYFMHGCKKYFMQYIKSSSSFLMSIDNIPVCIVLEFDISGHS